MFLLARWHGQLNVQGNLGPQAISFTPLPIPDIRPPVDDSPNTATPATQSVDTSDPSSPTVLPPHPLYLHLHPDPPKAKSVVSMLLLKKTHVIRSRPSYGSLCEQWSNPIYRLTKIHSFLILQFSSKNGIGVSNKQLSFLQTVTSHDNDDPKGSKYIIEYYRYPITYKHKHIYTSTAP